MHISISYMYIQKPCISVLMRQTESVRLPKPFPLPQNYPKAVRDGLAQNYLCAKDMATFVTAVAHALYSFKDYPTTEEYYQVSEEIVRKYPFLETRDGHVSQQPECDHTPLHV